MKAIILAAGKGERLGSITREIPKPMVSIYGKPILEHNIILLEKYGITDIYINLHHLPEIITDYFGSGSKWGVNIKYKYEEELLGTAGTVKNFSNNLDDTFIVMYGDNLFNSSTNIKSFIEFSLLKNSDFSIGLCVAEDISLSGAVDINVDQRVIRLIEKQKTIEPISGWVNAGIYIMRSHLIDFISEEISDFSYDLIPFLIDSDYNVFGYKLEEQVIAIDTPTLFNKANKS
ncbi:nucleotidyltransferase family protein [bacterium]|jgi:mannose-1-phosphate guanylyltransferase / phosphomannomutase|nr:nucleotidyltransferase family protein [bacterium]